MYTAEVIADSISHEGYRITTVKAVYPHAVHKDMLRHRCMNRNVASFRAMPPEKLISMLREGGAFAPETFGFRTKGMGQRNEAIEGEEAIDQDRMRHFWEVHVEETCDLAETFLKSNVAKQQVNFLLQDFCPLVEIITATDWFNFYALRTEVNEDGTPVARPEVYLTAKAIQDAINQSNPVKLEHGQLHLPMVTNDELSELCKSREQDPGRVWKGLETWLVWVSAGRCARISFGDYTWWEEDPNLSHERATRLIKAGHMSPFEQQARCFSIDRWTAIRRAQDLISSRVSSAGLELYERQQMVRQLEYGGNLHGWDPARKELPYEWDYAKIKETVTAA